MRAAARCDALTNDVGEHPGARRLTDRTATDSTLATIAKKCESSGGKESTDEMGTACVLWGRVVGRL